MTQPNLGRRGFLGLFAGAVAAAVASPIIKPKRSFFSFFVPAAPTRVELGPGEALQQAIDRLGPKGGTLFLKEGTFILGQTLYVPGNVSIKAPSVTVDGSAFYNIGERTTPLLDLGGDGPGSVIMNSYFDLRNDLKPGGSAIRCGSEGLFASVGTG